MSLLLQIVLSLAVVVLTVFLVMLLVQARRTAAAVERLADSASRDLRQVSEDIHEVRGRVEEMAGLVKNTLGLPSAFSQVVTGIVQAIPAFFARRSDSMGFLDALLTGVRTALHLFRRSKAERPKEGSHE